MKKKFLSTGLIIVFGVYALYQHIVGADVKYIAENSKSTANSQVPDSNLAEPSGSSRAPIYVFSTTTSSVSNVSKPDATIAPAPIQVSVPKLAPTTVVNNGLYRNGQYVGDIVDAYYGNVQVKTVVSGGKITDVQFLDYPHDRNNSIRINTYAIPLLTSETISAQSANVDTISGASFTSGAFRESLASALAQAQN